MTDSERLIQKAFATERRPHHGWHAVDGMFQVFIDPYWSDIAGCERTTTKFYLSDALGGHRVPRRVVDMVNQQEQGQ